MSRSPVLSTRSAVVRFAPALALALAACQDSPIAPDTTQVGSPQSAPTPRFNASGATSAKLFISDYSGGSGTRVLRYSVTEAAVEPILDMEIPVGRAPQGIMFNTAGEMFVVNRDGSGPGPGSGSISRYRDPQGTPVANGTIEDVRFNGPHWGTFRNGELFVANTSAGNVLRFLFDGAGNAVPNGEITDHVGGAIRGVDANPTTGEIFTVNCCGPSIQRFTINASGAAVWNGAISVGGSPHDAVFSPWGELFVSNHNGSNIPRFIFDGSGNAISNGDITGNGLNGPHSLDFSPWGELFAVNIYAGTVSRFLFDAGGNAIPNHSFPLALPEGGYGGNYQLVGLQFGSGGAAGNNPPVANDDAYTTDEDVTLIVAAPGVLANDTDADGDPLSAVLDTDVGNGSLTLNADGSFTYTPNADFNGADQFTYHANDGTDNSNIATVDITVNSVNDPPIADPNGPYTGTAGTAVGFDGTGSSDIDGTIGSYDWDFGDVNTGTGATPSHTYAAAGTYTVSLTVTDDGGATDTQTTTATINNVAPSCGTITGLATEPVLLGTAVSASALFTDPGTADTHTAQWDWDWPYGETSPGTVTQGAGFGSVDDSHTYTDVGVYRIELTVTDDHSDSCTTVYEYVVVYDPGGGFVTGGGWIGSPPGAYVPDPTLAGKANFGFVSKYKKGANVPTGNTEFRFKAGGFNFHSSSYEFLVITMGGTNAQFKGSGTINGDLAPNGTEYRFMLWARDGSPDTFRIKIWYENGGEIDVYDNGFRQPIGGGSIVIHKK